MENIRKLIGERWTAMKRWFLSKVITPERARKLIACALSWLIYRCMVRGTWDAISATTAWLRKIADFVDSWNSIELPAEKDRLIADLVADAVTDDLVNRLVDTVSELQVGAPAVSGPEQATRCSCRSCTVPQLPAVGGGSDAPVQ
jgi:hypothetical protein